MSLTKRVDHDHLEVHKIVLLAAREEARDARLVLRQYRQAQVHAEQVLKRSAGSHTLSSTTCMTRAGAVLRRVARLLDEDTRLNDMDVHLRD